MFLHQINSESAIETEFMAANSKQTCDEEAVHFIDVLDVARPAPVINGPENNDAGCEITVKEENLFADPLKEKSEQSSPFKMEPGTSQLVASGRDDLINSPFQKNAASEVILRNDAEFAVSAVKISAEGLARQRAVRVKKACVRFDPINSPRKSLRLGGINILRKKGKN